MNNKAKNSASSKISNPAELQNTNIRNSTECTGLRALITIMAENSAIPEKK